MKIHRFRLCAAAALIGLSACAAPGGGMAPRDPLAWQGAPADDLVKALGPPQARETLATGETVLQYVSKSSYVAGGYTTTTGGDIYSGSNWDLPRVYQPARTVELDCIVRYTIGLDNRVSRVERHGEGC
jgi:hypothetical protein